MKQLFAYKYRIYPNKTQEQFLLRNFGCARFVYNQLVANFNSWSPMGPNPQVNEKQLKDRPEYAFLKNAISYILQQKRIDFDEFKKQYFNKKRKKKLGRPNFKKRGGRESFRIPAASMNFTSVQDLDGGLKLPKLSSRIKIKIDRKFIGAPKSITVSKNAANQYFVSILVEEEKALLPTTGKSVGIDLGLIDLITLSDGFKLPAPKLFRKNQVKLAKKQRHLSRKTKGSNRYHAQRIKVAKQYQKITNTRNWLYHNISMHLVANYDVICMEDLNVDGMKRNRKLAKSIADASFSTLVGMVEYKCNWYGKTFHKIDRWFASSKICSLCGHKMDALPLSVREWKCPACNSHHDRDKNAATNILHRSLEDLYGLSKTGYQFQSTDIRSNSAELVDYGRGEELRQELETTFASSMKRLVGSICYRTT